MLLNRTHKIAAVYEQICPRPRILPPFFHSQFPLSAWARPFSFFLSLMFELQIIWQKKSELSFPNSRNLFTARARVKYPVEYRPTAEDQIWIPRGRPRDSNEEQEDAIPLHSRGLRTQVSVSRQSYDCGPPPGTRGPITPRSGPSFSHNYSSSTAASSSLSSQRGPYEGQTFSHQWVPPISKIEPPPDYTQYPEQSQRRNYT